MEDMKICPDCGKEIEIKINPITGAPFPAVCQCAIDKANREKLSQLQIGYEKLKKKIISENGIGRKFRNISLDGINAVNGQEKAYVEAKDFLKRYTADRNTKGFGLFGGVGSGKTYIAAALANQICNQRIENFSEREKEDAFLGRMTVISPVQFVSTVELLERLKINCTEKGDGNYMEKVKTAKVLIIDDLGAARITEWADERLFEIIDYRYVEELPTIFTTNAMPSELKEKIDKRTFDRLKEMCSFVSVTSHSQRVSP